MTTAGKIPQCLTCKFKSYYESDWKFQPFPGRYFLHRDIVMNCLNETELQDLEKALTGECKAWLLEEVKK